MSGNEDMEQKQPERLWLDAVVRNDVAAVEEFLHAGASVDEMDYQGHNMLSVAAWHGCMDVGLFLINKGADVNKKCSGVTPLMRTALMGRAEFARMLIINGADVDARGGRGFTALHLAAIENRMDVVRVLVEHGADANLRDDDDATAEVYAAARSDEKMRLYLRAAPEFRQRRRVREISTRNQQLFAAKTPDYVIRRRVQP